MSEKPGQHSQHVDYKAKYEKLYRDCGEANAVKKELLVTISKKLGELLKISCEPDPPGCSGPIPGQDLEELFLSVQQANATKQEMLQSVNEDVNLLMQQICEPDPPGCIISF